MRRILGGATVIAVLLGATPAVAARPDVPPADRLSWTARHLGRQALPERDGWAADDSGTTGGSAATPERTRVVHSRAELVAALGGDNASNATPKLIYVDGVVQHRRPGRGPAEGHSAPQPLRRRPATAARVRFGQVDVYNNHYRLGGDGFQYALGVGVQSAIYAQNNFFTLDAPVDPADLLYDWGGTALTERGSWVRQGGGPARPVDLLAAYNATHDPDLAADAGWTPTLRREPVLPAPLVPLLVGPLAGADRLPI
ncbi:hypothetical protein ACWD69_17980 [Micromonospora chokoriensis]